jgi:hypothetical protein
MRRWRLEEGKACFFEKKKQKTFVYVGSGSARYGSWWDAQARPTLRPASPVELGADSQKSFGSFLQKRTFFLTLSASGTT